MENSIRLVEMEEDNVSKPYQSIIEGCPEWKFEVCSEVEASAENALGK